MSILVNKETALLLQGITGKEGRRAIQAARNYRTYVAAGVTPGKGGQTVDTVPVYDSVAQALARHPSINTSAVYVPPYAAKDAVLEAIAQHVPLVNVMTERIPIQDTSYILAAAADAGCTIVGPSSLGIISSQESRIGLAGGETPDDIYRKGPIGIISRSGGMMNEIAWQLRRHGLGISTAVHIGGDLLIGTSYRLLLKLFEHDAKTCGIAIFGEMGGEYEYEIVQLIEQGLITKPIAIAIGGLWSANLPAGMALGHAGALIERGRGSVTRKREALTSAGVTVVDSYEQIPERLAASLAVNKTTL